MSQARRADVENFLFEEAWLLDQGRFEEWLDLFADDIRYWMPVRTDVARGEENLKLPNLLAHFDDNKFGLTARVQRIRTGYAHADEPPARTRHLVSNVRILGEEGDILNVTSNFLCFKSRLTDERLYSGCRNDRLRRNGNQFKIAERFIVLDHDVVDSLTIFF